MPNLSRYNILSNPSYCISALVKHLQQHSAPLWLSPAPPSQTLPEEKWTSLPPYKTAGILLRTHKHTHKEKKTSD